MDPDRITPPQPAKATGGAIVDTSREPMRPWFATGMVTKPITEGSLMNYRIRTTVPAACAVTILWAAGGSQAIAADRVVAEGVFSTSGPAYTYDGVVPTGATAVVRAVETGSGRTVATLHVRGLAPRTNYSVHAHTGACGSDPLASAGHYQHEVGGAVDGVNELWLGFTTNPAGNGSAQSVVEWTFRTGDARSVTFHDPAQAGERVACLPVAF